MDILAIFKDFGFPVALCAVLLLAIRHMAQTLVKAYTDRIKALENAVSDLQAKYAVAQADIVVRSDRHAAELKAVAERNAKVIQDHDAWTKQAFSILSRLIDSWQARPCLYRGDDPTPAPEPSSSVTRRNTPSSAELPPPPEPPTEGRRR